MVSSIIAILRCRMLRCLTNYQLVCASLMHTTHYGSRVQAQSSLLLADAELLLDQAGLHSRQKHVILKATSALCRYRQSVPS